jgi:hypothetical protein
MIQLPAVSWKLATDRRCDMRARVGDTLMAGSGGIALIVEVLGTDGHPPYIVKWLSGGNIAMVDPDPYARVIPADRLSRSGEGCDPSA